MRFAVEFKIVIELGSQRASRSNISSQASGTTWGRLRKLIKKRDDETCRYCGEYCTDGHLDHITPLSKGGTDSLDNLVWSCPDCNLRKTDSADWKPLPASPIQIEITRDNLVEEKAVNTTMQLPISAGDLHLLARGLLIDNKSLARSIWAQSPQSRDKLFKETTFREVIAALREQGLATQGSKPID